MHKIQRYRFLYLDSTAIFNPVQRVTGFTLSKYRKNQYTVLEPPAEAVYTSLEGAERIVLSHAISEGYSLSRSRSKKCRSGEIRKVWLVCAHDGRYKNRREYLTDESRKRRSSTRSCKCPFTVTVTRETVCNDDDNDHDIYCSDYDSVEVFQ